MQFWIFVGGTVPDWLLYAGLLSVPVIARNLMKTSVGRQAIAAILRQIGKERA